MKEEDILWELGADSVDELVPIYCYTLLNNELTMECLYTGAIPHLYTIPGDDENSFRMEISLYNPKTYSRTSSVARMVNGRLTKLLTIDFVEGDICTTAGRLRVWFCEPLKDRAVTAFRLYFEEKLSSAYKLQEKYQKSLDVLHDESESTATGDFRLSTIQWHF